MPVKLPQLLQIGEQLDVGGGAVEAALPQQLHQVLGLHEVHEALPVTPVEECLKIWALGCVKPTL